jgi:hypothetical protein
LALVPGTDQTLGVLEQLRVRRAPSSRFLLSRLPALIFHFAAVESHSLVPGRYEACQHSRAGIQHLALLLARIHGSFSRIAILIVCKRFIVIMLRRYCGIELLEGAAASRQGAGESTDDSHFPPHSTLTCCPTLIELTCLLNSASHRDEHCQAAKGAAANPERHSEAERFSEP